MKLFLGWVFVVIAIIGVSGHAYAISLAWGSGMRPENAFMAVPLLAFSALVSGAAAAVMTINTLNR
jgi:hypothetical protein